MNKLIKSEAVHDIDMDDDMFVLYLAPGWQFSVPVQMAECSQVRKYDSLKQLKSDFKLSVVKCGCKSCMDQLLNT